jgi:CHAT domain-containing protein
MISNKIRLLGLLLTAILVIKLTGQQRKARPKKEWYEKAQTLYKLIEPTDETDSMAMVLFLRYAAAAPIDDPLAVASLINAGNIQQGGRKLAEANALYYQAIAANKKGPNRPELFYEAYLYLGSSLYYTNIDSAKYYFEAASDIALNYPGKEPLTDRESLYNSLGAIYYESANYQQSKNYFEKATEFLSVESDEYEEVYNGIQTNIASCLMKLARHGEAIAILRSLKKDEANKKIITHNTAHCYFELGAYDSAMALYRSYPVEKGYPGVVALTDIGRIFMLQKRWQRAEEVFDSAIALNKDISLFIKNKEEALAYHYRSQLARQQGLLDEALTWSNEALKEIHLSFTPQYIEDLPEDISKTVSAITQFKILVEKASLLYQKYHSGKRVELLIASLLAYRKAIETANFIKLNFDNDEATLFFNQSYKPIYGEAIEVAYEAVNNSKKRGDDYLYILENYKGSVLYKNLQNIALKSSVSLPDNVRKREKEIKDLLAVYTTRINQNLSEKEAVLLQKRFLSLQVELSRLQQEYEEDPVYSAYKVQFSKPGQTISSIQSSLDNNTALLNYYMSDSFIYCLAVTNNKFHISRTPADSLYWAAFTRFTNEVYEYQEGKRYDGFSSSAMLFQYLVRPSMFVAGNRDKWVIIPDGHLYYVPFDALMENADKRDYLILSKAISYHYSFSLLLEKNTHHKAGNTFQQAVAYAPYAGTDVNIHDTMLPELPLSAEEVKNITPNIFLGKKATRSHFLAEAGKHPVIHLATHASIGTDSSSNWIQFYPQGGEEQTRIYLPEIYNLNLQQTELVVLSACETGGGIETAGEGLLSLSRAFMYAGADGIVSTLWKSEDMVTAYLMQRLYGYLKQKHTPGSALRLAKMDLLNDKNLGSQFKKPNYWANFIYAGKHEAEKKTIIPWWVWAASLAIAGIIFSLFLKIKGKLRF